jgi:hypothetical protein
MQKIRELKTPRSCLNRANPHEWLFVLLARDEAAPVAIRAWIAERIRLGKNKEDDLQILEAFECVRVMELKWSCNGCGWNGPLAKAFPDVDEPPACPICG